MLKNEIAMNNEENAMKIAAMLVNEDYVVMVSKEEELTIINYEYSEHADRNRVMFMNREEFERQYILQDDDEEEEMFGHVKDIGGRRLYF